MIFKTLNSNIKESEQHLIDYWKKIDILNKSIENRAGHKNYVFYEGPPTANGNPGIHHVLARTIKDGICKYHVMKGERVVRKAGWDTHGLPVEIEVEKQLNLKNKTEIEAYGIAKFNEKCKESVFAYESRWREMTTRMGHFIDMDNPYITLNNDYIESVWWSLNKFYKEGYMYEGHKVMPYCSRCGTGLASHELSLGYAEIQNETAIVPMKRKGTENEYFLAWTTTPWTLVSNVALTVHPDEIYVKVKSKDTIFYCAKALAAGLFENDYEVLEEMKGKEFEYIEYEQLIPFVKVPEGAKAFFVTCADYVTTEDGTGIVHCAPAFGEEDYQTGMEYGLPVLQPVDESGVFTTTPWKGKFVIDADKEILAWLKAEGKLFKKQRFTHNYPHCWRCRTPLLYYAKSSWYIKMTALKDVLIKSNNEVNWHPDFVGEKRFGNWIENVKDWAISRNRYWGTPLNIWRCSCGSTTSVGSRAELKERAIEDIDINIELHRPYVDDVHLTCEKCGGVMTRVKDVIDCWFDSGSMPYAQYHYPFENEEIYKDQYPADFICEGIDQTRGWFYSLIAISAFLNKESCYKNVLVNDLILDAEGRKMSKSRGNTVNPFELFDQYGADALRWYMLHVSPVWTPTKFDVEGLKEVKSKFFDTLRNVYNFFALYANTDNVDPKTFYIEPKDRDEIDKWILSKYNKLVKDATEAMDDYDMTKTVKRIQQFVNEDLSNWYIRRNRRRFWGSELTDDKKAVFNTTYEVLRGVCLLAAPFAPYLPEDIYRNLTGEVSVHLGDYPICDESLINEKIEERMDLVRELVSIGRSAREDAQIKVRQPLSAIHIDGRYEELISGLIPLMKEELNVQQVRFEKDLSEFMDFSLKPNYKTAGPVLGPKVKLLAQSLQNADANCLVKELEKNGSIDVNISQEIIKIDKDLLDIRISAKEGFNVQTENNLFIILDTHLTEELLQEGLARELVSKVQQMRKNSGFEVMDRIDILLNCPQEVKDAAAAFDAFIKKETLADAILFTDEDYEAVNLNGYDCTVKVVKK